MAWGFRAAAFAAAFFMGAATAAAQQTNLIFATLEPPGNTDTPQVFQPWAQRIAAASGGAIHIDIRDGVAIANFGNVFDRVQHDIVQIGLGIPTLIGGRFPLTEVVGLPFVTDDALNASVAFWRLYKTGLLDADYKQIKPLAFALFAPQGIHLAKPPATLDNLDGLRLRVVSKISSDTITRLGGAPMALDPMDIYTSLQRGMIDGVVTSWMGIGPLKLLEVTRYHVETGLGTSMFIIFMDRHKFESLPAAARRVIDDNSGESLSRALAANFDQEALDARKPAAAAPDKHTIVRLTPAQDREWHEKVAPVIGAWTAAHPGGQKVLDTYRALIAQVKAGK